MHISTRAVQPEQHSQHRLSLSESRQSDVQHAAIGNAPIIMEQYSECGILQETTALVTADASCGKQVE